MTPQKKRRLCCAFGGVLLLKHWLFGDYGPLDRFLEMTVVAEVVHRRADAKHRKFISEQIVALTQRLTKGERLRGGVPDISRSNLNADGVNTAWIAQVREWVAETDTLLSGHSAKASTEFMSLAGAGHVNLYVGNPPHGYYLRQEPAEWYKSLTIHLENLRRIISTPEAYFEHGKSKQRSTKI